MSEILNFVVAVIRNSKNELLLLRRSSLAKRDPNKWGLSGGRLELGEDPDSAMARELREELGNEIELQLQDRLGPLPAVGNQGGVVHLFKYQMTGGSLSLNHEHTDFQWVNGNQIKGMDVMAGVDADLTYFGIQLPRA